MTTPATPTADTSKLAAQIAMRRIFPRLGFAVRTDGSGQYWLDAYDADFKVIFTRPASEVEHQLYEEREAKANAILNLIAEKGHELHAATSAAAELVDIAELAMKFAEDLAAVDVLQRPGKLKEILDSPLVRRRSTEEIMAQFVSARTHEADHG